MKALCRAALVAVAVLAAAAPVEAHVFGAGGAGFAQGLAHPLSGLDHLLAMIAVGLWASQIGGRAILTLPIAFPLAMAAGALLGGYGVPVPSVEAGVAASVVALGAVVALGVKPPLMASVAAVGLFAVLHGHAHGAELPEAASPLAYGAGFLLATVALHAVGVVAGLVAGRSLGAVATRVAGGGVAIAGMALVAQVV